MIETYRSGAERETCDVLAVVVHLEILPGAMTRFLPLMRDNAAVSLREERGCRRFDVWVDVDREDAVLLHEVYDDAEAFEVHLHSSHYRAFNAASAELVASKTVRRYREPSR